VLALKASAVLMWIVAVGFGAPAPFVATYLLRERSLPIFMGLFPMYGGGFFERWSPVFELFAGMLVWHGEQVGALITLALLPIELAFWAGFAVPIPPLTAVVRVAVFLAGWSALR
jgi:hypothetical protein